jgi:pyruvate,water dikinase
MTHVLWLDDPDARSGALVGGKFSSLAELTAAGFGVPPAFAVTTEAYAAFLREAALEEQAHAVHDHAAGEAMRAAIEAAPLPAAVADAVDASYARLCADTGVGDVPVAVRSSGVAEDLAGASFAGQYETYLWIVGADAVRQHVRRCWTGLFGDPVLAYRPEGADLGASGLAMAVVVQQMVQARAAGVMFTLEPVTGDRSKIVIEAAWGLGEAVVSGEVTPDRFLVDKVTLEIVKRTVSEKTEEFRFDPDTGVGLHPVPDERRAAPCLDDAQIVALATLAKRIERHRGAPQDIEWAVDEEGRVHVLQVRPETVWSRRESRTVAAGTKSAVDLVLGTFVAGGRLSPPTTKDGAA